MKTTPIGRAALFFSMAIATMALFVGSGAEAATQCSFTRNIAYGSQGADVACLQRFLNESGYTVAYAGPGSYGYETAYFGSQTLRALTQWQNARGIYNESGYFGPSSRSAYYSATGGTSPYISTHNVYSPSSYYSLPVSTVQTSFSLTSSERALRDVIEDVIDVMRDAIDEIDRSNSSSDKRNAERALEDAQENLFDALLAYFDGRISTARSYADDALDDAEDALDYVDDRSSSYDRDDALDAIEDAEDAIDDAEDEIDDADRRGRDVDRAEDYLRDAEDALRDAEDAFDDRDYRDAIRYAEDAEDYAEDAIDAL